MSISKNLREWAVLGSIPAQLQRDLLKAATEIDRREAIHRAALTEIKELETANKGLTNQLARAKDECERFADAIQSQKECFINLRKLCDINIPALPIRIDDAIKQRIVQLEAELAAAKAEKVCEWTMDDDGCWNTGCGNKFEVTHGRPEENKMAWCCFCRGMVVEK